MPTKAHRGAAMMRHVADIKSTHSSNNCEHYRRPLDVIMTTQPSSRIRGTLVSNGKDVVFLRNNVYRLYPRHSMSDAMMHVNLIVKGM